jgi:hypothetical protein
MADAARGPETGLPCDYRAHQFIRVETALHQHLGLAFTYKVNCRIRSSLAMRRVDELVARNVYTELVRDSLDFSARPDQDWREKTKSGSLDRSPE